MPAALKPIKFDSIDPSDDFRYRCTSDQDATLERLAQDIQANGLVSPLVVRATEDGHQLVAGFRRYRAIERLREADPSVFEHVHAHVHPVGTEDLPLLHVRFSENFERKSLSPMDIAFAALKLKAVDKLKQKDVQEILRLTSEKAVQRHLRLTHAPKPIQEAVNSRSLSPTAALAILELGDPADKEAKEQMLSLFADVMKEYDPDEPESRPMSVQAIRKAVTGLRSGESSAKTAEKRVKQLRKVGLGVRKVGDGYRLSLEMGSLRSLKGIADVLRALGQQVDDLRGGDADT